MPKVTAPLLSFDAAGQIGNAMVFAKWRGIQYARRYAIPGNPNTADQQETRNTFKWLNDFWRYAPSLVQEGWNAYASGQPLTGRNALIKFNLSGLREETDLTNFSMSPSAKSGPVAASMTPTPGDDSIAVALGAPTLPSGWTIDSAIAAAIPQQDPQTGALFGIVAADDDSDPYSVDLTGLLDSTEYVVGGWFKYVRPDTTFAYGPALMDTATTT